MTQATENPPPAPLSGDATVPQDTSNPALERILGLTVPVAVVLAERPMPVETILRMSAGTILEFDAPYGSDLMLMVGNRVLGHGQAVKIGEHFGLRISAIDTIRHRIEALGDQPPT